MKSLAFSLACLLFAACGDDSTPPGGVDAASPDGAAEPDAEPPPPPDAAPPDATPLPTGIGELCPTGTECAAGLTCLDETLDGNLPANGYCSKACTSDADCGWDSFCSPPLGGGPRFCFQRCTGGDESLCSGAPERVCSQTLLGFIDLGEVACLWGDPTAIDGSGCVTSEDCNAGQFCLSNPFDAPGGMCLTVGCTIGDDSTCTPGGDGTCIDGDGTGVCVDQCTMPSDCRTAEGYTCIPFPTGDMVCFYPHADPGAACAADTDCGPAGGAWRCLTTAGTVALPGGYCSGAVGTCNPADESTCPGNTTCYDNMTPADAADDYCAANCAMASDCRMAPYGCFPSVATDPASQTVCVPDVP